jgi:SAM-dependent methyltransferase
MTEAANAAQIDYWNTTAGDTWVQFQDRLDVQLEPLGLAAMRALAPQSGERIVDIGCGCGHSSVELAAAVGPSGSVVGVDISRPMLKVARGRAVSPMPDFLEMDVQAGDLGEGVFDAAYSRFGVMFFSDPVLAFTNIRRALKPGGRLAFVCWRPFEDNPWMRTPMDAAAPFLPPAAPVDPAAPGPFAFADAARIEAILDGAGFSGATVDAFDARIGGSDLDRTVQMAFQVGPLSRALKDNPQAAAPAAEAVRAAIARYETPDGVLMPAAVWIVRARNP